MPETHTVERSMLESARAIAHQVWQRRDEIESTRSLPHDLTDQMKAAGLFHILLPRTLGGSPGDPLTAMTVIEEISHADGAAGWNLMIGLEQAMLAGYMREETAREIWRVRPRAVTAGSAVPRGRAVAVDGGYRVSGQWPFASGCDHADYLWGACMVMDGDTPRVGADGNPLIRNMLAPAEQCTIVDTWSVAGLRGTGSQDFSLKDCFVPEGHAFSYRTDPYWPDDPLFCLPYYSIVPITLAMTPLGIARRAIDTFRDLAGSKTPAASRRTLRDRPASQIDLAKAEALYRSGRAYLYATVEDAWRSALAGTPVSVEQRMQMRLASVNAAVSAASAVDLLYNAAGATSIYTSSPLERCFRDVHVATQHAQVQQTNYETVGRVLVGLEPESNYL